MLSLIPVVTHEITFGSSVACRDFQVLTGPCPPSVFSSLNLVYMGVSTNNGTPKSWISTGFSVISHPFWGTPIFGNNHYNFHVKRMVLGMNPSMSQFTPPEGFGARTQGALSDSVPRRKYDCRDKEQELFVTSLEYSILDLDSSRATSWFLPLFGKLRL